ncbi:Oidioi.mRNA.OKI2018_I69.chr2.g5435.t1.cds [Oikopleura dioica]|uniref:Oidioi.mRNA.OKI2018_I69.chr2.g5435.t1.cds n=1 Tax=Oikopleura dioica TaxID=34765 RepID=A0ABN7T3N5_OIKDI|nr:Oidioi.mRNA.OKI2018_I69.chr2.g5435.t1.cds [Oikopleura dioica]
MSFSISESILGSYRDYQKRDFTKEEILLEAQSQLEPLWKAFGDLRKENYELSIKVQHLETEKDAQNTKFQNIIDNLRAEIGLMTSSSGTDSIADRKLEEKTEREEPNQRAPTIVFSDISDKTPSGFAPPSFLRKEGINRQDVSEEEISTLIDNKINPLWNAQQTALKQRSEIQSKVEELDKWVKNTVNEFETKELNNMQLQDESELMRETNAQLQEQNERYLAEIESLRNQLESLRRAQS